MSGTLRSATRRPLTNTREAGFTLVEVAIVLVIVGLLLGLSADFVGSYLERQRYQAASDKLTAIDEALVRFVSVTGRLPCPASGSTGNEDGNPGSCSNTVGTVPWLALGIAKDIAHDFRGDPFSYAVPKELTNSSPKGMEVEGTVEGLKDKGFMVKANSIEVSRPNDAKLPTGAAYVLLAENWTNEVLSEVHSAGKITFKKTVINELLRHPTVLEVASRAGTLE